MQLLTVKNVVLISMAGIASAKTILGVPIPDGLFTGSWYGAPDNNFDCIDSKGRNPVVLFHGLSASREVDLNLLHKSLVSEGWCVFSKTYGSPIPLENPPIGGLRNMTVSSHEIADFILQVSRQTKHDKVDIVGHSEGGVMVLYVPMTRSDVAAVVDHAVALGPAVHGAHYFGAADFFQSLPSPFPYLINKAVGKLCEACVDMEFRDGVITQAFAAAKKIVPSNIKASIIMSNYDTLVNPATSKVNEVNVKNIIIQDSCPDDHSGHANLAWSKTVWGLIKNELQETPNAPIACDNGTPW